MASQDEEDTTEDSMKCEICNCWITPTEEATINKMRHLQSMNRPAQCELLGFGNCRLEMEESSVEEEEEEEEVECDNEPSSNSNYYEGEMTHVAQQLYESPLYISSNVPRNDIVQALKDCGVSVGDTVMSELVSIVKEKIKKLYAVGSRPARREYKTAHERRTRPARTEAAAKKDIGCALKQDYRDDNIVEKVHLGPMDKIRCAYCGAIGFENENKSKGKDKPPCLGQICCNHGKVEIPIQYDFGLHPYIEKLLTFNTKEAIFFRTHSRMFNNGMAMSSVATADKSKGWGKSRKKGLVNAVRIHGQLHRRIGPMLPRDGVKPKFMQTYFYEPDEAAVHRLGNFTDFKDPSEKELAKRIFTKLHKALEEAGNTYINDCYAVKEYIEKYHPDGVDDLKISIHVSDKPEDTQMKTRSGTHIGRLNKPTVNEVSILFPNDATADHQRCVVFNLKQPADEKEGVVFIRDDHRSYDPTCYPLLFNK